MLRRSTIVVLIIFLALIGVAYYLQGPGKKLVVETTPTVSRELLFSFKSEIVGVKISKPGMGTIVMRKDPQGVWKLTSPATDATDTSKIETAISQLMSLQVAADLELSPSLDAAGLSAPSYQAVVTLADGTEEVINVGNETPTKGNYYVQIGNRGIFVVNKYSLDSFLKLVETPPILASPTPTEETPTPTDESRPVDSNSATPIP